VSVTLFAFGNGSGGTVDATIREAAGGHSDSATPERQIASSGSSCPTSRVERMGRQTDSVRDKSHLSGGCLPSLTLALLWLRGIFYVNCEHTSVLSEVREVHLGRDDSRPLTTLAWQLFVILFFLLQSESGSGQSFFHNRHNGAVGS